VRLDLLKTTYRLDASSQPRLPALAGEATARLGLDLEVTFYQSQQPGEANASLAYLPGEAHIVFQGPLLGLLSEEELRALLGHELTHHRFLEDSGGEFLKVGELLAALAADDEAEPAHVESLRLFGLYTEIYADRGAFHVCGDLETAVSMLVKVTTGLEAVSAASYLQQADEIFSKASPRAEHLTHPEAFIRARALRLWAEEGEKADGEVARMIEGEPSLEGLDLVSRKKVETLTLRMIRALLAPAWFRTEPVLAHARLFESDFTLPDGPVDLEGLAGEIRTSDDLLSRYYAYVLLDFATVDRSLEEHPLAAAVVLSRCLGFEEMFLSIAGKELQLRKRQVKKLAAEAQELLARVEGRS
jgi:hypothetical protein